MNRVQDILSLFFSEDLITDVEGKLSRDSSTDSLSSDNIRNSLDIEVFLPKYSNLYMTIPHPAVSAVRVLEYSVKISKRTMNDSLLRYSLELYRDGFDIGTYNVLFTLSLDGTVFNWIDYPITPFQLSSLIDWLKGDEDSVVNFDGVFRLILDDFVKLRVEGGLYYLTFSKKHNDFDDRICVLTREEYLELLNQFDNLNSKINVNSSVYNYHRLYMGDRED